MSSSPACIGRIRELHGARILIDKPNNLPDAFDGWAIDRDIELTPYPPGRSALRSMRIGRARISERSYACGIITLRLLHRATDTIPLACVGDWVYVMPERTPTVEPSTREQYARGYAVARDLELHVAVEIRGGEDGNAMSELLRGWAEEALAIDAGDHAAAVDRLERWIAGRWPGEDRAYFIETDQHNRGLQIYQPYGRPRIR